MDAFRTDAEIAFRRKAREFLVREPESCPTETVTAAGRIWRDLLGFPGRGGGLDEAGCPALNKEVLAIDEASCHDPRLGLDLIQKRPAARDSYVEELLHLAGMAGAASHVFAAGTRAARTQGLFLSSLMGFRDVQERLAGLVSGAELLRLGTIRLCRLADRGGPERGERELELLRAKGRALVQEARSLALDLLGEDWTRAHLPEDGPPPGPERTQP